jgi:hypothetical protein
MAFTGTCTYLATKLLNSWWNATAFVWVTPTFLALDTGTSTAAGAQFEVTSGNAYARLSVTLNSTNFPVVSATSTIINNVAFTFVTATGAWTGNSGANTTVKWCVNYDAVTTGNAYLAGILTTAETVVNADVFSFPIGNFSITQN